MDESVEPMPDAPEGTCVPAPEAIAIAGRDAWAVRGRRGWFRCNPHTSWCECAEFLAQKRRGQPLTPCAHLRALARHRAGLQEAVNPAIHTKINGGMQAFCEERMADLRGPVTAMETLSWTDAELRRLFS